MPSTDKPWDCLPVLQTPAERKTRVSGYLRPLRISTRQPTQRELRRAEIERRYKMAEKERRYNGGVFAKPKGRICLVEQCSDCKRFCHYPTHGLFWRRQYGEVRGERREICWTSLERICYECIRNNSRFSKVAQCDRCKRFHREGQIGVTSRWDCRDPGTFDPSPKLCVACWNRERPIWRRWRDAEETRRAINRFKREISKY